MFGAGGGDNSGTPQLVSAEILGGAGMGDPGWTLMTSSFHHPYRYLLEVWTFMSVLLIPAHVAPSRKQGQALSYQAEQI